MSSLEDAPMLRNTRPKQHLDGFFGNAHHFDVYGGSFTNIRVSNPTEGGFQILQEHVASSAFHNSKQRVDPPRCHERTREAILEDLFDWIVGSTERTTWIAWLNGAAGAGKSAICQSTAEICILRGILVASFFFFRADGTRNNVDALVATLAYQIIQLLPGTKEHIVNAVEENPLIFEQSLDAQLHALIIQPLLRIQIPGSQLTLLLIIDGVDECDATNVQTNLILTIARLLRARDMPLIVLFGSRREHHIQMAFDSRDMRGILTEICLDDNYQPDMDIWRFLDDSLAEIKEIHPFRARLPADWPLPEHVQEIVKKSSGQFIYAAVVVRFLALPTSNPSTQFDTVRGLRPSGRLTPFAELDALYMHIFSQVIEVEVALDILAFVIYRTPFHTLGDPLRFFQLMEDDALSALAPLNSVLFCNMETRYIVFRHASIPDFLCNKARSKKFCIVPLATKLSVLWFKRVASGHFDDPSDNELRAAILDFLPRAEANSSMRASIMEYSPSHTPTLYRSLVLPQAFLSCVEQLDFGDRGEAYICLLTAITDHITIVSGK